MQRFEVRRAKGELLLCPQKKFQEPDEETLITLEVEGEALALLSRPIVVSLVLTIVEAGLEKNTVAAKDIAECPGFTSVLRELLESAGRAATFYRPPAAKKPKKPKPTT